MNIDWQLPRNFEQPFREALDHASKRHIAELRALLGRMTEQQIDVAVNLCSFVAAYTAIDVVSRKWPTDDGLRFMAEKTVQGVEADAPFGVTEQNVYLFLSRCALGFESFPDVFSDVFATPDELLAAPFFLTVDLLATFAPKEKTIWEFLDAIEDAYEKAWLLDLDLLPALMVRARMPQQQQAPDASAGGQ